MLILCANVGSTSFKYQIIDVRTSQTLVKGVVERIGNSPSPFTHVSPDKPIVRGTIEAPDHNAAIAHSINLIVHPKGGAIRNLNVLGGVGFKTVFAKGIWRSAIITEQVIVALEAYIPLVPLHNSAYIASIRAFQELAPNTPLVAVLETWFHQTIPDYAYDFGVPRAWVEKYQVRRYGFHGASHRYIAERVPQLLDASPDGHKQTQSSGALRIISCHLGGSSSLCAIRDGKSIDTTMGVSTQYGLIQSTRSGDFDPFAMLYVMEEEGWDTEEIRRQLINESGLLGISGVSGDVRDIEAAAKAGNDDARLALDTYFYGVKKYIGAYIAALGGVDVIAFTGGIGEKSATAREAICDGLQWQGILLDSQKNENHTGEGELSIPDSRAKILVIPANEEFIVARETAKVIRQGHSNA
jgi:acetate kinase